MKYFKILLLLLIGFGTVQHVNAQRPKAGHIHNKQKAKRAIRRTAAVIVKAHKAVKQNKNYTGKLALAVRHQRYARALYRKGNFARAVHQTRMARRLAFLAIQDNKGVVDKKDDFDKDEFIDDKAPTDEELTKELPNEKVTDEELINAELTEIDLSDSE